MEKKLNYLALASKGNSQAIAALLNWFFQLKEMYSKSQPERKLPTDDASKLSAESIKPIKTYER